MSLLASNINIQQEINDIKSQIVAHYSPSKIFLFGSQAKGTARQKSDIDICIIKNTDNKRNLLADLYLNIDTSRPVDFVLYTEDEWEQCIKDSTSFAYQILKKGTVLYD